MQENSVRPNSMSGAGKSYERTSEGEAARILRKKWG